MERVYSWRIAMPNTGSRGCVKVVLHSPRAIVVSGVGTARICWGSNDLRFDLNGSDNGNVKRQHHKHVLCAATQGTFPDSVLVQTSTASIELVWMTVINQQWLSGSPIARPGDQDVTKESDIKLR